MIRGSAIRRRNLLKSQQCRIVRRGDRNHDHARRCDRSVRLLPFRKPSYTGEERKSMIDRIGQHVAGGHDVFAYFKHEETPEGALYAVELLREVS